MGCPTRPGPAGNTYQGDFSSRNLILKYHIQFLLDRINDKPLYCPGIMMFSSLASAKIVIEVVDR